MSELYEGDIVIVTTTGQCGTVFRLLSDNQIMVILRNNDVYTGYDHLVYFTENLEEQNSAPLNAPRFEPFFDAKKSKK